MALISIIIPVYNASKTLNRCIDSLINQTYKNIEIICVNDGSTDNSLEILYSYAQYDTRITIINKEKNESSALARRSGFEASKGNYITFVDSDDFIELDMIEKLYSCSISEDYDIVSCGYYYYKKSSRQPIKPDIVDSDKKDRLKYEIFGFGNSKMVWNKLVKRHIYSKITFAVRNFAEDVVICSQLLYYADKIGYCNSPLYHLCWSDSSITRNITYTIKRYEGRKANYEDIITFCKEKFGDNLNIFQPELNDRMAWLETKNPNSNFYTRNFIPVIIGLKHVFRMLKKNGIKYGYHKLKSGIDYYIFDKKANRKIQN